MPFTKLDSEFASSSLFAHGLEVVGFWAYLLSQADAEGRIAATIPDMAARCRVPEKRVLELLQLLESPDEWSRTPDHDGRRIRIERSPRWSVVLLNHQPFNESKDPTAAERQRRFRERLARARDGDRNDRNVTRDVTAPSASASAVASVDQENGRESDIERSGPRPNPLVSGRRPDLESECLRLVRTIHGLTGDLEEDIIAEASHYTGAIAGRTKLNPASMGDDRLLNTVRDLRKTAAELQRRKDAGVPIR